MTSSRSGRYISVEHHLLTVWRFWLLCHVPNINQLSSLSYDRYQCKTGKKICDTWSQATTFFPLRLMLQYIGQHNTFRRTKNNAIWTLLSLCTVHELTGAHDWWVHCDWESMPCISHICGFETHDLLLIQCMRCVATFGSQAWMIS